MQRTEIILDALLIILIVSTAFVGYFQTARVGVLVGDSMKPTMHDGDLTIYEPNEEASVGDIIIFTSTEHNNALVSHRVVKKNQTHYVTKGDNNPVRDAPIRINGSNYRGRIVYHIPLPGGFPIPQKEFINGDAFWSL